MKAGFNRNIVECKDDHSLFISFIECVLIETLWNVKLISTLLVVSMTSFNRNIVECKVVTPDYKNRRCYGFNRNIVECKAILSFPDRSPEGVLIETLWNVKL